MSIHSILVAGFTIGSADRYNWGLAMAIADAQTFHWDFFSLEKEDLK